MRQGNSNKRMRGRGGGGNNNGGGRKGPNPLSRTYESTGPDVKIRGTALHIAEKYVSLARDAQSSGDPVLAENYLQHAEHYYRIIAAAQASMPQSMPIVRSDIQSDEDEEDFDETSGEPVRVEPRGEARGPVGEDGFMPADAPQPFLDEIPSEGRPERVRDDRPRGERPERNRFRTPRGERTEAPREGNRFEGRQRPPRAERPARGEPRGEGERSEAEGDLSALPAFLTAAPSRVVATPAPEPVEPMPASADVEASEPAAEEAPKRRTRGGRGRGRRPEYEAGSEDAPAVAPVEE